MKPKHHSILQAEHLPILHPVTGHPKTGANQQAFFGQTGPNSARETFLGGLGPADLKVPSVN